MLLLPSPLQPNKRPRYLFYDSNPDTRADYFNQAKRIRSPVSCQQNTSLRFNCRGSPHNPTRTHLVKIQLNTQFLYSQPNNKQNKKNIPYQNVLGTSKNLQGLGCPRRNQPSSIHNIRTKTLHRNRRRNPRNPLRNLRYRHPHPPIRMGTRRLSLRRRARNHRHSHADWHRGPKPANLTRFPTYQSRRRVGIGAQSMSCLNADCEACADGQESYCQRMTGTITADTR